MSDLLNSASLVLIPSGYKEDIVYSAVPTDGSGDLSFTRASNGTRVNSAGLVEVCPWNLAQYSEDFSNAVWTLANVTVTANDITAPNGTLTADKFTISVNGCDVKQTISVLPNTVYTWSFYVYGGTALGQQGRFYDNTNLTNIEYYNYSSSVVLGAWVKIERTFTTPSGCYEIQAWVLAATSTIGTMWAWGCQLNIGSTAKPYFPTTDRLNVPRLTYQNGGGGCPSLLLEKQSTNLTLYSDQLDNAVHTLVGVTITANNITSPDGTQNADKITETTANSEHIIYDVDSNASGTYTLSAFLKGGAGTIFPVLRLNGADASQYAGCIFNTSTGAVVNTFYNTYSAPTTKVENMGNGWYRVSMTTTTTNTNYGMRIGASDSASPSFGSYGAITYTGSTSNYFYAYGAQLEASSYPTSYIPTTSASATRVADYPSRSGLALTNFTFAVNFKPLANVVELFDFEKTGGGRMFYVAVQSNGFITFNSVSGGTIGAIGSVLTINQTCKLAFKLNASTSNLTVFINGSNIGTYTTNITTFGAFFGLQSFGYNPGTQIEQIAIFPSVLTDAECISLTTI